MSTIEFKPVLKPGYKGWTGTPNADGAENPEANVTRATAGAEGYGQMDGSEGSGKPSAGSAVPNVPDNQDRAIGPKSK